MGKILIADDEPHLRRILISNLKQEHHEVVEAAGVNDARSALAEHTFDAVITDQKMGDGEGLDVLAAARETDPTLSVVFLTAFATIELAVESMRRGAFDFITKPFVPEVLLASATRAMEHTRLVRENSRLRDTVVRLEGSSEITGRSAAILQLHEKIARVAPTNATVLITGETGTGKELVARAIHHNSLRAGKPLVAVNCAAFTETLLESELFGHERGAFTGADRAREGVFEAAHEGTLFLDEAAEMSLPAQAKLLRVLTDGLVTRLGSTKPRHTDVRLLVATNRDLKRRVHEGRFSRGSVLPARGSSAHGSCAARSSRGYTRALRSLSGASCARSEDAASQNQRRGDSDASQLRLSGEYSRTSQPYRARVHSLGRRGNHIGELPGVDAPKHKRRSNPKLRRADSRPARRDDSGHAQPSRLSGVSWKKR